MNHLKFVDGSDEEIEGMLAPHGGIFNGRDAHGEYFSAKTDFVLDLFNDRPLMFHHGLDTDVETAPVGRIKSLEHTDEGLWMKGWLDKRAKFYGAIKQMIGEHNLELSSGTMNHLVRKSVNGEVLRWPVVEGSFTATPACPGLATVDFATAKSHFKSADIEFDEDAIKAKMDAATENDLPDSDFAYIDSSGNRKLPINDESHVRNALARFDQTEFESDAAKAKAKAKILAKAKELGIEVSDDSKKSADAIKSLEGSYEDLIDDLQDALNPQTPFGEQCYTCIVATYADHVIAERHEYGSDDMECTYWSVAYTTDEDGEPVLGAATQVEQTYVPAKAYATESPITLDAQLLSRHAGALAERTKALGERRIAEGRVLSTSNRTRIADTITALDGAKSALQTTVDASDALHTAQVEAEALMQPASLQRRLAALDLLIDTSPA